MEITVVQGNITELKTDAVVVNLFEGSSSRAAARERLTWRWTGRSAT